MKASLPVIFSVSRISICFFFDLTLGCWACLIVMCYILGSRNKKIPMSSQGTYRRLSCVLVVWYTGVLSLRWYLNFELRQIYHLHINLFLFWLAVGYKPFMRSASHCIVMYFIPCANALYNRWLYKILTRNAFPHPKP